MDETIRIDPKGAFEMCKLKSTIVLTIVAGLLFALAGCDSYAQKREAAYQRWEKTTAKAKVPLARDYFQSESFKEAHVILTRCIEADPELLEAHMLMGKVMYSQGRLTDASESFATATKLEDWTEEAWYMLGRIAQQQGDYPKAIACFRKAIEIRPINTDYIIALARTYSTGQQYTKALALLSEKSILDQGNVDLNIAKADILLEMGKVDQAIKIYNRGLLIGGADSETIAALGYCYIMADKWEDAARMFETLTESAEGETKVLYLKLIAMCSMNGAEYGKAVEYYDRLTVDDRESAELWLSMGHAALGADAPNRAANCAVRALELRPAWADAIALNGCSSYLKRDYNSALTAFRKIASDKQLGPFAWLMTSRCYQQLGQTARAEKALKNARHLDPDSELVTLLTKL